MKKRILNKIEELIKNLGNFVYGDYYTNASGDESYEVTFDESKTADTLIKFAEWILKNEKRK